MDTIHTNNWKHSLLYKIGMFISWLVVTILAIGIMLTIWDQTVHGEEWPDGYWEMRICYVDTAEGAIIPVYDTWELISGPTVGSGTTSGAAPLHCLPYACPEGYFMVSATCSATDPFAHIPVLEEVGKAEATHEADTDWITYHYTLVQDLPHWYFHPVTGDLLNVHGLLEPSLPTGDFPLPIINDWGADWE